MEAELGGGRSSRWQRTDSFLASIVVGRSYSSRLILESSPIVSECPRYERISKSMRSPEELPPPQPRRSKAGAWRFLTQYFSGKKLRELQDIDQDDEHNNYYEEGEGRREIDENKDRKKRRASWLPDPERRWPVQGW